MSDPDTLGFGVSPKLSDLILGGSEMHFLMAGGVLKLINLTVLSANGNEAVVLAVPILATAKHGARATTEGHYGNHVASLCLLSMS
ncbi:hypothetical protein PWG14_26350 [Chromobacterium amazonense]|uniref:hypothetical protein n=1 Tax=Chromobacterium amazonense TaxID=1382803 RepID=UPI00237D6EAE|nr:hypothetical protein [Chromobacterium amazonense]MDE1715990.1 hypothetical protein [Chromobacterium amazonense]